MSEMKWRGIEAEAEAEAAAKRSDAGGLDVGALLRRAVAHGARLANKKWRTALGENRVIEDMSGLADRIECGAVEV